MLGGVVAKPAASHKVAAAQIRPSGEPNYAGVANRMPLIKAKQTMRHRIRNIFDAVERETAAVWAADQRANCRPG